MPVYIRTLLHKMSNQLRAYTHALINYLLTVVKARGIVVMCLQHERKILQSSDWTMPGRSRSHWWCWEDVYNIIILIAWYFISLSVPVCSLFLSKVLKYIQLLEEGKIAAAHVACTKEYLLLSDVQRDRRFAEGLKWVDAKVALCMPVVKPDGECYAVLELFRTYAKVYDEVSKITSH